MSNIVAKTEELVKPICEAAQVDLVDVEYVKEGQVFFLRVYVDTPEGIDIDQCATIAEALSEKLDIILPIKNKQLEKVYGIEPYTKDCIVSLCEQYAIYLNLM